jgi:TP901 family phage tail tape measure protein
MNAYKVEVKDAADVSDFMFQLVRKGVGSYDEFAKSIGRAIPSARRAGQSYQTLGAMMAFLTRNGLSAAMAATSSARALDAIAHPETIKRLEEMGVQVRDAKGEFLPLVDILGDMNKEFGDMTAPERSKALYELFKSSGGTIQARRFFDNYFKNAEEFNQRTKEMGEYAGEAGSAFKKMANSPQADIQRLQNQWMLLRIELGQVFMPIAMKIVDVIRGWIEWFRRLSPETQETILKIGALVVAIGLVGGAIMIMLGFIGMAIGGLNLLGLKAGSTFGKFALAGGGLAIAGKGLSMITDKSSTAEKAVGILGMTAGGALTGFAVGGPIGAAIGGGIGLLGGLGNAIWDAGRKMDEGEERAARYAEAIDKIAAASGKAQRAEALRFLQQEGMISTANSLGIETNTLVHALLGNKDAIKRVTGGWKDYESVANGVQRVALHKFITEQGWALKNTTNKMDEAKEGLKRYQKAGEKIPPMTDKVKNALKKLGDVKPNNEFVDFFTKGLTKAINEAGKGKDRANNELKKVGKLRTSSDWIRFFNNDLGKGKQDATLGGLVISENLKKGTGKARADMSGFNSSLTSGINTARSNAASGGSSIGNALGSGIYSSLGTWMGSVIGRAASMVSQAVQAGRNAAEAKSPSRKMMKLGKDMADGLAKGIKDNGHKPKKEMSDLVKRILNELTRDMRSDMPKAKDLLELSKTLLDNKRGKLSKKKRASLLKSVADETAKDLKRLQNIVKRYRDVAKRLDDARDRLRTLREEQRSYQQNVEGAIMSYGSFASFGRPTDVFGNEEDVSLEFIKTNISSRLAVIREYGQNLKTLLSMGYSKAVYDMVVQLGPELGNEYAKALIAATPTDVKEINRGIGQIQSQASGIASAAGSAMYDAGIKAAEGLVAGLEKKKKELERVARELGRLIAQTIRKELGIKSPSKVGIKIGSNFGSAIARGMHEQSKNVSRASSVLARAAAFDMSATTGSSRPFTPVVSGYGGAGGDGKVIHNEIDVYTQEIDPRANAAKLGWELAQVM